MNWKSILLCIALIFVISSPMTSIGSGSGTSFIMYSFDLDGDGLDDRLPEAGPFHVVIHHSSGSGSERIRETIQESGGSIEGTFTIVEAVTAVVPTMDDLIQICDMEGVLVIEKQIVHSPMMDTSVPAVRASPSEIYSPQTAHELGYNGTGVTLAIIDSGVDNEHPFLTGSFVAGADFTLPATPLSPRDGTFDPDDRSGHGTGVASIALGRQVDEFVGAAPGAGLIDLKVVTSFNQDMNPFTNEFLSALQWCGDNSETDWGRGYSGVDIVSISLGIGPSDGAVAQAMDALVEVGTVVVQSAGNSGGPYEDQTATSWPDGSIVVGGIDHMGTIDRSDDEFWTGSTSGPRTDDGDPDHYDELRPDVTAPCSSLNFAAGSQTSNIQGTRGLSQGTGTSYATPHVAGTIACMLQANPNLRPDSMTNPVKKILHRSSEERGDPTYPEISMSFNANYGWGILDAYEAVKDAKSYSDQNHRPQINSFTAQPERTTTGSVVTLKVSAIDMDEDPLTYQLEIDAGELSGEGPIWEWTAPNLPGNYSFLVIVSDPSGSKDQQNTGVEVIEGTPNRPPVITSFNAASSRLGIGDSTRLTVVAFDPDSDELSYEYDTITGTIQGTGPEVTYVAPTSPGTDTVYVIVTDPSGASDDREITISITEDQTNSPPSILLLSIEPETITANLTDAEIVLYASVEDPDGLLDIDQVIADLSKLGGSAGEEMKDDGQSPDEQAGDGIYSLVVLLQDAPRNGIYNIEVTVFDQEGETAVGSVDLRIEIESAGEVDAGQSSGPDLALVFIILAISIVVIIIITVLLIGRGRKKRRQPSFARHPTLAQVRYRPSAPGAPPIEARPPEEPPKFNVVSGP